MAASTGLPVYTAARRRRGGTTAARILDAAEELFAERGYAGTTLRDIAARVGIRNPSLYNHYQGKDSIYEAVLARRIGPVFEALTDFVEEGSGSYRNAEQVVERVMQVLTRHPHLPRLIHHETLTGGHRLTPILRDLLGPTFARAYEMVESGPASKRWGTDQVPLLVLAMYHIVIGYFTIAPLLKEISGEDLMSEEALARQTRFLCRIVETLFADVAGVRAP